MKKERTLKSALQKQSFGIASLQSDTKSRNTGIVSLIAKLFFDSH